MIYRLLKDKRVLYEWVLLLAGCLIYAASMVYVNQIAVIPGSMLGIAVTSNHLLGTPIGLINLLLNIPIMILITKKQGVKILAYTVFIMLFTALLIDMFSWVTPLFKFIGNIPIAVIGGLSMGIGAGMLIAAGGTMAGTTALTLLIHNRLSNFSFGTILFALDSCIMLCCAFFLKSWSAILYSAIYGFTCAKMMDLVLWFSNKLVEKLFQKVN